MFFGTVSGGLSAELTGGNFWQGAAIGLTVSGLNHVAHKNTEPKRNIVGEDNPLLPPGEIEFKDLTDAQLADHLIIPEDVSDKNPTFAPTENKVYKGDGFYFKCYTDEKYWYKVANGSRVIVTYYSGTGYNYTTIISSFWQGIVNMAGEPYIIDWQSKQKAHWTANPFDLN